MRFKPSQEVEKTLGEKMIAACFIQAAKCIVRELYMLDLPGEEKKNKTIQVGPFPNSFL